MCVFIVIVFWFKHCLQHGAQKGSNNRCCDSGIGIRHTDLFGGFVSETGISEWLYLVIIVGSLYLGLGKRRNELRKHTGTRDVLRYYTDSFLDKNMYVCVALADVFYALWTIEMPNSGMIWTVPIFIIILMCYSMDIERDIDGDPTDVILHDKILLCLVALFAAILFMLLYI